MIVKLFCKFLNSESSIFPILSSYFYFTPKLKSNPIKVNFFNGGRPIREQGLYVLTYGVENWKHFLFKLLETGRGEVFFQKSWGDRPSILPMVKTFHTFKNNFPQKIMDS